MGRLLLVLFALLSVGCDWSGSKPLPDREQLKFCKESCPAPGFCAHDGVKWGCIVPAEPN